MLYEVITKNIKATTRSLAESRISPPTGIFITGTQNHPIGQVRLKNISIQLPGGGTKAHATITPEEMDRAYPEFTKFGILPAYGMYSRHIEKLETKGLKFNTGVPDERKEIIKE